MENPIKMDDLGVRLFLKTSISRVTFFVSNVVWHSSEPDVAMKNFHASAHVLVRIAAPQNHEKKTSAEFHKSKDAQFNEWCTSIPPPQKKTWTLLPRNLTWNLKMMVSKRNLLFQGLLFRFHVKFQGCICLAQSVTFHLQKRQPQRLVFRRPEGHTFAPSARGGSLASCTGSLP